MGLVLCSFVPHCNKILDGTYLPTTLCTMIDSEMRQNLSTCLWQDQALDLKLNLNEVETNRQTKQNKTKTHVNQCLKRQPPHQVSLLTWIEDMTSISLKFKWYGNRRFRLLRRKCSYPTFSPFFLKHNIITCRPFYGMVFEFDFLLIWSID